MSGSPPRVRRVRLHTPVSLYDGERSVPAELCDLSESGAFVALEPPLPLDTGLSFWLVLDGSKVLLRGRVRWTRSLAGTAGEPVGCGLEFHDPDGRVARELGPLLQRVAARRP